MEMKGILSSLRVLIGFIGCALLVPIICYFLGVFGAFVGLLAIATIFLTALVVFPIFSIFYANKWFKLWQAILAGGFIAIFIWLLLALDGEKFRDFAWFFLFAPIGMAHGLLFWLIAIWDNTRLIKSEN